MSKRARKLLHKQIVARAAMRGEFDRPPLRITRPTPWWKARDDDPWAALRWMAEGIIIVPAGLLMGAIVVVILLLAWCATFGLWIH